MNDLKKVYREVNIILDLLGNNYKKKLPKKMVMFYKEEEDKSYNPKLKLKDLNTNKILPETKVLICMLYINYWTRNEEEKEMYKKMIDATKAKNNINTDAFFDNHFEPVKDIEDEDFIYQNKLKSDEQKEEKKEELALIIKPQRISFKQKIKNFFNKIKKSFKR